MGLLLENVQVHLPEATIATTVEDRALRLLLQLFDFEVAEWPGRTFTTGATSSNIMGLACGREYIIDEAIRRKEKHTAGQSSGRVGEMGLLAACRQADIIDIQILTTLPHSSLKKASCIVGLGRSCFHQVSRSHTDLEFDLDLVENLLKQPNTASIVVISCAEVNTGLFATHSREDVRAVRALCDKYSAWLHVDAAFGLFARVLEDSDEFSYVRGGAEGLELADSIAGDGHKLLNVPYDCGFFFCRHAGLAQHIFQNQNAAYLNSGSPHSGHVESPLNVGLENSRRFRALPVYATLMSYGRGGYRDMLHRQIEFARRLARYISQHPDFDLLPQAMNSAGAIDQFTYIIVLFRAKDEDLNSTLVKRINDTSKMYVSGTSWDGNPACRIAAANWQADPERDSATVQSVIEGLLQEWHNARS
ncbi:MAG: hypothetical protein Q9208_003765 [Pyrenodesmia sp. 3 TL-2023]